MKRVILLFFLVLEFKADLVLEITESASKPVKIAILEKNSNSLVGQEIINVISNDLKRTGEFRVLGMDELLSIPINEDEVIHPCRWKRADPNWRAPRVVCPKSFQFS